MKEVLSVATKNRETRGTSKARRMRSEGLVPCIVYGHKEEPRHITVAYDDLLGAVRHHTRMLDLDTAGAKERVILHDVQFDAFGMDIIHADFVRVAMDELIRIKVPVELRGKAAGEVHGGVAEQLLTEVEVECLPGDIPDAIPFVISSLEVGQSVAVSQLVAPAKVRITSDPTHIVVTVASPKVEAAAVAAPVEAAAVAGVEPEVITRGKAEEGEEGEEAVEAEKEKKKK
jgi:large subunit ribosomal protein L25